MKTQIVTQLSQFSKQSHKATWRNSNQIVLYTRVSDSSQSDNTSLDTQKKDAEQYAKKKGLYIKKYFGGTFESAKTDQRKEFKKMLEYVKKDKTIAAILVYSYERFSRSEFASTISRQLTKLGIKVLSVIQDFDVTTASGQFQQDIFYAFGNYDNVLRKDKVTRGMIENLRNGYWVNQPPHGYTNLNRKEKAKYHNYIINKDGELLKLGFKWKAEGKLSNLEIVQKLQKLGSKIVYKSFVQIINNPFYCGYLTNSLIPGEIIKGRHPALVSESLFLKANVVAMGNPHKGISKKFKNEELPLKSFLKDEISNSAFTGYLKKGIYYYKTRGKGNAVNERADVINQLFIKELSRFNLDEKQKDKIEKHINQMLHTKINVQMKEIAAKKKKLTELANKLEALELRYIENEIDKELYEKYCIIYKNEKDQLLNEIEKNGFDSSNLEIVIKKIMAIARNIIQVWVSSDYDDKQRLQYLIYPQGIWYNKKEKAVRTPRVNTVFACMADAARVTTKNKNGYFAEKSQNSYLVESCHFELLRPTGGALRSLGICCCVRPHHNVN